MIPNCYFNGAQDFLVHFADCRPQHCYGFRGIPVENGQKILMGKAFVGIAPAAGQQSVFGADGGGLPEGNSDVEFIVPARRERFSPGRASRTITWPLCQACFYAGNWLRGLSFFAFGAKQRGQMTQENNTTTERKLWFSGAWGRSLPTSIVQFGPDCIACHYYPEWCANAPVLKNKRFEGIL